MHADMWDAHCLSCICQFINNEYNFHLKTTVQITLIVFLVHTFGDFISYILSHLRYEHWFQLVNVNIVCFSIQTNL